MTERKLRGILEKHMYLYRTFSSVNVIETIVLWCDLFLFQVNGCTLLFISRELFIINVPVQTNTTTHHTFMTHWMANIFQLNFAKAYIEFESNFQALTHITENLIKITHIFNVHNILATAYREKMLTEVVFFSSCRFIAAFKLFNVRRCQWTEDKTASIQTQRHTCC